MKRQRDVGNVKIHNTKKLAVPIGGTDDIHDIAEYLEESTEEMMPESEEVEESKEEDLNEEEQEVRSKPKAWDGKDYTKGMLLDFNPEAYTCLQRMTVEWPSLSFDILSDKLGARRTRFPLTFYYTTATSAGSDNRYQDRVTVNKVVGLYKTTQKPEPRPDVGIPSDEEESSSSEEFDEQPPMVLNRGWKHPGGCNRIRAMPQKPNIIATWSDRGEVHVWDGEEHLKLLDTNSKFKPPGKSLFVCKKHTTEGYALAWNIQVAGRLATGDCNSMIFLWNLKEGGGWEVGNSSFSGHTDSVEDLHWSPSEDTVFATCSVDKSIRIWDIREPNHKSVLQVVNAHSSDVNVLDWNLKDTYLLASGGDDALVKVWDLRTMKSCDTKHFHSEPISSVRWHPNESSVLAVAADDDITSIWDLSWEADETRQNEGAAITDEMEIPTQLAFVHRGQSFVKEIHWHRQIPSLLMSTAQDGFNIFKPSNFA